MLGRQRWADPWDLLTSLPLLVSGLLFILQVEDSDTKTRYTPSKEWLQELSSDIHRHILTHTDIQTLWNDWRAFRLIRVM